MSNVVKVYNYDSEGEITATGIMDLDIFKQVPINATVIQPPKDLKDLEPNETLWFNEDSQEWVIDINETYQEPVVEEPIKDPDYISKEQRIEELELALADLIAGGDTNA